jgi:hypothetical protein
MTLGGLASAVAMITGRCSALGLLMSLRSPGTITEGVGVGV